MSNKKTDEGKKTSVIKVSWETHQSIRVYAANNDMGMSEVAELALNSFFIKETKRIKRAKNKETDNE